jgi:RHS repeat-associated protein
VAVPGGISTGTWYDVKLDMQGTTLKAYVNGTQLLTQTDSSCTSGSVGVGSVGASFEADDVRVIAPTTNACVQNWKDPNNQCGSFCTYETGVQSDRAGCGAYLDCYANNGCSPETCGGDDDVCGVHNLNPWGNASKEVADQVYKCMGCAGSVNCANPKYYNGTVCADGSGCTWGDTCQNQVCIPDPNRNTQCTASDQCHDVGTCDTTSGKCSNPSKADDITTCDDGNACTQTDTCQGGVCVGSDPIVCAPSDSCHTTATCDTNLGACTNAPLPEGTLCDDGNACTQTDTCDANAQCIGSESVTCAALDTCHVPGICDPWSGTCNNPPMADGEACDDGNPCTSQDQCISGVCTAGQPVVCQAPPNCDSIPPTCDPANGGCAAPTGCVVSPPAARIYSQTWDTGSIGGWADSAGNPATTATDATSPDGPGVQSITKNSNATTYQPDSWTPVLAGESYCVSAYVRWISGSWPFIGLQLSNASGEIDWVIGQGGYTPAPLGPITPISAGTTAWQYVSNTVNIPPNVTAVRLVDELWSGASKGGVDSAYFDGLSIDFDACPTGAPETVYQQWWELGTSGWADGNGKQPTMANDPSSPAGPTVQVIDGSTPGASYASPPQSVWGGETICVWSSVRWVGGNEPFVAVKLGTDATPTVLVGAGAISDNLSTTDGWQTFGVTVLVPSATQPGKVPVQIVDGVSTSNTNAKQGTSSYFDNMSITAGPCQRRPAIEYGIVPSQTIPGVSTPDSTPETPGRIDGSFAVTDNGQATYRIPLWVPSGRNGVQPNLALAYNSDGGDGLVGQGWHLDGFSRIERCPRDYARDRNRQAIKFDDGDALCLDGERLVVVSGDYFHNGSEYRTENDKYIKIVQVGYDPNGTYLTNSPKGPGGFEVYLPDGTRRSYGYTDQATAVKEFHGSPSAVLEGDMALISASDSDDKDPTVTYYRGARLAWLLASSRDRFDNEVTYSYTPSKTWGTGADSHEVIDFLPESIAYTSGTGITADRKITFEYDDKRADVRESFVSGVQIITDHLLTKIHMYLNGTELRYYQLDYQGSNKRGDAKRALLSWLYECDGNKTCKPPTKFDWTPGDDTYTKYPAAGSSGGSLNSGDFNGDGMDDIVVDAGGGTYEIRLAVRNQDLSFAGFQETGTVLANGYAGGVGFAGGTFPGQPSLRLADLNNDGITDVMMLESIMHVFATGGDCNNPQTTSTPPWHAYCALYCQGDNIGNCMPKTGQTNPPTTWPSVQTEDCPSSWCPAVAGGSMPADWQINQCEGSTGKCGPTGVPVEPQPLVGDFDGDGFPDIIRPYGFASDHANAIWAYMLNSPTGFGTSATNPFVPLPGLGSYASCSSANPATCYHYDLSQGWSSLLADINGDGKVELLVSAATSSSATRMRYLALSFSGAGSGTTTLLKSGWTKDDVRYQFADINGDGLPDAIEIPIKGSTDPYSGNIRVWKNSGSGFLPPVAVTLQGADRMGRSMDLLDPFYVADVQFGSRPRDTGLRIADIDGDGRADLVQMGDNDDTDPWASLPGSGSPIPQPKEPHVNAPGYIPRSLVTVLSSDPLGTSFEHGTLKSSGQDIPLGDREASIGGNGEKNWGRMMTNSYGSIVLPVGFAGSQLLDVNGDGLADIVQSEKGNMVVYVRNGQKPGLLTGITDGFGNSTGVVYTPITDRTVHTPVSAGGCLSSQYCNVRGRWIVKSHTLAATSQHPLPFKHEYGGARQDVQGLGYLGMDNHWVWDESNPGAAPSVATSYDHMNKFGALFYPGMGLPAERVETYPMSASGPGGVTQMRKVTTTNCTYKLRNEMYFDTGGNGAALVDLSSCLVDEKEYEDTAASNAQVPTKEVRVSTTYESTLGYGYITEQDTAYGTATDLYDASNEVVYRTPSNFSDNPGEWLIGRPQTESTLSVVPARADTGTPATGLVRSVERTYDQTTGALLTTTLDPEGNSPESLYQKTIYDRTPQGLILKVTVQSYNDTRERYTKFGYNINGAAFPDAVRVGGMSKSLNESAQEQLTTLIYDQGTGLLLQSTDSNELTDSRQFDTFGRLLLEQKPDGSLVSRQYSGGTASVPYEIVSTQGGGQLDQVYDSRGLVTAVKKKDDTGAWFVASQIGYEAHGWVNQVTRPFSPGDTKYYASYAYDAMGRPTQEIDPVGSKAWTYAGLMTTQTTAADNNGGVQVDTAVVDQVGRVIRRGEQVGKLPTSAGTSSGSGAVHVVPTTYVYGPFSTLSDVFDSSDGSGHDVHMDYDLRGRRIALKDPNAGTQSFTYDTFGEVVATSQSGTSQAPMALSQAYGYDVLGRKISEQTSENAGNPTSFNWDSSPNGKGKLAASKSRPDNVGVQYEYDLYARIAAQTLSFNDGSSYRLSFGYDDEGRLSTVAYPPVSGTPYSVTYGYSDVTGELKTITDGGGNSVWTANSRNLDRRVTQETFGDKSTSYYTYWPNTGLLWAEAAYTASGTQALNVGYSYDLRGYLSGRTAYMTYQTAPAQTSIVTEAFTHDELGRLTHWASAQGDASGAWSVHYDYDDSGNIKDRDYVSLGDFERKYSYTTGPTNAGWGGPHAVTEVDYYQSAASGGTISRYLYSYSYDGAGRQVTAITPTDSRTQTFTDFDLPRRITGSQETDFLYDADHQRAAKVVVSPGGSPVSSTIYLGKLYEKRTDSSGAVSHVMYVRGESGAVIAQRTQPDGGGAATMDYLHNDRLGSVTHIASSDGSTTEARFDPFGARLSPNAPPGQASNPLPRMSLGFTGQENEDDLGLINFNGRIYDPNLMRFLSADPIISRPMNSQGYNRYSYANNSPFHFKDPSGFDVAGIVTAILGGGEPGGGVSDPGGGNGYDGGGGYGSSGGPGFGSGGGNPGGGSSTGGGFSGGLFRPA